MPLSLLSRLKRSASKEFSTDSHEHSTSSEKRPRSTHASRKTPQRPTTSVSSPSSPSLHHSRKRKRLISSENARNLDAKDHISPMRHKIRQKQKAFSLNAALISSSPSSSAASHAAASPILHNASPNSLKKKLRSASHNDTSLHFPSLKSDALHTTSRGKRLRGKSSGLLFDESQDESVKRKLASNDILHQKTLMKVNLESSEFGSSSSSSDLWGEFSPQMRMRHNFSSNDMVEATSRRGSPHSPLLRTSSSLSIQFFHLSDSGNYCAFLVQDKLKIIHLSTKHAYTYRVHAKQAKYVQMIAMHPRKKIVAARAGNLLIILRGKKKGTTKLLETMKHVLFDQEQVEWIGWVQDGTILAFVTERAVYHLLLPATAAAENSRQPDTLEEQMKLCPQGYYEVFERDSSLCGEGWKTVDYELDSLGTNSYLLVQRDNDPSQSMLQIHKMHSGTSKTIKSTAATFMRLRTDKNVVPCFSFVYKASAQTYKISTVEVSNHFSREHKKFQRTSGTVHVGSSSRYYPKFVVPCPELGLAYIISSRGDVQVIDVFSSKSVLKKKKCFISGEILHARPHKETNGVVVLTTKGEIKVIHIVEEVLQAYIRLHCPDLPRLWKEILRRRTVTDVTPDSVQQKFRSIIYKHRESQEKKRQASIEKERQIKQAEREQLLEKIAKMREKQRERRQQEEEEERQRLAAIKRRHEEIRRIEEEEEQLRREEEEQRRKDARYAEKRCLEAEEREQLRSVRQFVAGILQRTVSHFALEEGGNPENEPLHQSSKVHAPTENLYPSPSAPKSPRQQLAAQKEARIQKIVDRIHLKSIENQQQEIAHAREKKHQEQLLREQREAPDEDILEAQNALKEHAAYKMIFLDARPRCAMKHDKVRKMASPNSPASIINPLTHIHHLGVSPEDLREFCEQLNALTDHILCRKGDMNIYHPHLRLSKQMYKAIGLFVQDAKYIPVSMKNDLYACMKQVSPTLWAQVNRCMEFLEIRKNSKSKELLTLGEPPLVIFRKQQTRARSNSNKQESPTGKAAADAIHLQERLKRILSSPSLTTSHQSEMINTPRKKSDSSSAVEAKDNQKTRTPSRGVARFFQSAIQDAFSGKKR